LTAMCGDHAVWGAAGACRARWVQEMSMVVLIGELAGLGG
jgi:hypothetical protein